MNKIFIGVAVALLSLGTAAFGMGMPLAGASSGSGNSGNGSSGGSGSEARVINTVEREFEDGEFQIHERREVRNPDGSRVRVDVTHEIEDGMPVVTIRERTRDAAGNQTDVRERVPAGTVSHDVLHETFMELLDHMHMM